MGQFSTIFCVRYISQLLLTTLFVVYEQLMLKYCMYLELKMKVEFYIIVFIIECPKIERFAFFFVLLQIE